MISILKRSNWLLVKIIILITILVPLSITAYEVIILQKDSVLFLGDFHPAVAVIVLVYYIILLLIGVIWTVIQLKSVLALKNENRKSELLHLQSQVNPHFFFNMLNNLYGLVDKDSEKAKALILKLSELMRYSIYEGEKSKVTLEEEVEYLRNYIELHQMRYYKNIDVKFVSAIENNKLSVVPLLFIILLENAFKHGVENLRDESFIHLYLKSENNLINFNIENNFDPSQLPEISGIGIKNLKRRLDLAYPNRHSLNITSKDNIYKVSLKIQL